MTLDDDAPVAPASSPASSVRARFFAGYQHDAGMRLMDAVVCSHPVAGCEVYLPLAIPIILYVTTRFDLGRLHSAAVLERWILAVAAIAAATSSSGSSSDTAPAGVVVANNEYDAAYVEYFTGVRPEVLPSLCVSTAGATWTWPPARKTVLLDVCDVSFFSSLARNTHSAHSTYIDSTHSTYIDSTYSTYSESP